MQINSVQFDMGDRVQDCEASFLGAGAATRNVAGCQKFRLDSEGIPAEKAYFCSSFKQFFSHTFSRFQELSQEIRGSQDAG